MKTCSEYIKNNGQYLRNNTKTQTWMDLIQEWILQTITHFEENTNEELASIFAMECNENYEEAIEKLKNIKTMKPSPENNQKDVKKFRAKLKRKTIEEVIKKLDSNYFNFLNNLRVPTPSENMRKPKGSGVDCHAIVLSKEGKQIFTSIPAQSAIGESTNTTERKKRRQILQRADEDKNKARREFNKKNASIHKQKLLAVKGKRDSAELMLNKACHAEDRWFPKNFDKMLSSIEKLKSSLPYSNQNDELSIYRSFPQIQFHMDYTPCDEKPGCVGYFKLLRTFTDLPILIFSKREYNDGQATHPDGEHPLYYIDKDGDLIRTRMSWSSQSQSRTCTSTSTIPLQRNSSSSTAKGEDSPVHHVRTRIQGSPSVLEPTVVVLPSNPHSPVNSPKAGATLRPSGSSLWKKSRRQVTPQEKTEEDAVIPAALTGGASICLATDSAATSPANI